MVSLVAAETEEVIKLVDVATDSSACIFEVYGETVVVDKRDKQTVNGVTIYVQEVYAVNTGKKDQDNCAFLYYFVDQPETKVTLAVDEETIINKEIVGDKTIEFVLTSPDENIEVPNEDIFEYEKEANEATTISIDGKTVETKEPVIEPTIEETQEPGFLGKIWRFLFGQ